MVIFARLVCMLFAIASLAAVGKQFAEFQSPLFPSPAFSVIGGFVGIFFGMFLSRIVVGRLPKD